MIIHLSASLLSYSKPYPPPLPFPTATTSAVLCRDIKRGLHPGTLRHRRQFPSAGLWRASPSRGGGGSLLRRKQKRSQPGSARRQYHPGSLQVRERGPFLLSAARCRCCYCTDCSSGVLVFSDVALRERVAFESDLSRRVTVVRPACNRRVRCQRVTVACAVSV